MNNQYIGSYAAAKIHYENTKPIRGSGGVIPLGNRRDWHRAQLVKDGDAYCCRFWRTDIFRFEMRGNEEHMFFTTKGYNIITTTREFMAQVGYVTLKRRSHGLGYVMNIGGEGENYYYDGNSTMHFKRSSFGWVLQNPKPTPTRVIDRELSKAAREEVKPLLQYAKVMTDITGGERCCDREWGSYGEALNTVDMIRHLPENTDITYYYALMQRLSWRTYEQLKRVVYAHLYQIKGVYKIVLDTGGSGA